MVALASTQCVGPSGVLKNIYRYLSQSFFHGSGPAVGILASRTDDTTIATFNRTRNANLRFDSKINTADKMTLRDHKFVWRPARR